MLNNSVFLKNMENVRKNSNTRLVTTENRKNYLVLQQNHHPKNCSRKIHYNRNEKAKINLRRPVYLSQSILEIIKIAMQKIWFDYAKPKYGNSTQVSIIV